MSHKVTTMKALVEAIQDAATSEDEAIAALTHLLSRRGVRLTAHQRGHALTESFF